MRSYLIFFGCAIIAAIGGGLAMINADPDSRGWGAALGIFFGLGAVALPIVSAVQSYHGLRESLARQDYYSRRIIFLLSLQNNVQSRPSDDATPAELVDVLHNAGVSLLVQSGFDGPELELEGDERIDPALKRLVEKNAAPIIQEVIARTKNQNKD